MLGNIIGTFPDLGDVLPQVLKDRLERQAIATDLEKSRLELQSRAIVTQATTAQQAERERTTRNMIYIAGGLLALAVISQIM